MSQRMKRERASEREIHRHKIKMATKYLPLITLNVNDINSQIKRHREGD